MKKRKKLLHPECQPSPLRAESAGVGEALVIMAPKREAFGLNFER